MYLIEKDRRAPVAQVQTRCADHLCDCNQGEERDKAKFWNAKAEIGNP